MISQFTPPTVFAFSRFVLRWLELLAEWRFDEAAGLLDPAAPGQDPWGIAEIQQALREIVGNGELPGITDPRDLPEPCGTSLSPTLDGRGFTLCFPLPLEDGWSDVFAVFDFLRRPGGYAMVLKGFGRDGDFDDRRY